MYVFIEAKHLTLRCAINFLIRGQVGLNYLIQKTGAHPLVTMNFQSTDFINPSVFGLQVCKGSPWSNFVRIGAV